MNLDQLIENMRMDSAVMANVTDWRVIPARTAKYSPYPDMLPEKLRELLTKRGIRQLYTHQASAYEAAAQGKDIVVVTPTASGKTMCYNVPVLSQILKDNDSRALYLFPTKALSADQVSELYEMITDMGVDIKTYTYDGDTPEAARRGLRQAGHIIVTNPDMLHSGILPQHTKWVKLFENLKYIVIDEIHTYRGLFGSNLANVLRRLRRICEFYGSHPQFICCSATIKNPKELTESIIGREVQVIDNNGAPSGEKHIVMYDPPVINKQLGIRRPSMFDTRYLAENMVRNDISTIVFAKSRLIVEVLTKYLKRAVEDPIGNAGQVRAYRGGFLPTLRRQIEKGLRHGDIRAVVSTNALELGIDIGSLECCILCGYPGTIASTWQQMGRAGRRHGTSLTIMVASGGALDQYIVHHPDYFFGQSPENAMINPDNLYIMLNHMKCAAYELLFHDGDSFSTPADTAEMLAYLTEQNILRHVGDKYYWSAEEFPASETGLRTAASENFIIIDITNPEHHLVIGEMDRYTVPMLLHENAIYMHEAAQYQVEKLDFDAHKAYVRQVDVDYYTDADLNVSLRVLDVFEEAEDDDGAKREYGEVLVTSLVKMFKKMKLDTHENLGFGHISLPEMEMQTTACWWTLPKDVTEKYGKDELQGAMMGVANLLRAVAPLYLMCAPRDFAVIYQVRSPFTGKPTMYLYDNCPGGVGLSEKSYNMQRQLLQSALELAEGCDCDSGCPSCVGPVMEVGEKGKRIAIEVLRRLIK